MSDSHGEETESLKPADDAFSVPTYSSTADSSAQDSSSHDSTAPDSTALDSDTLKSVTDPEIRIKKTIAGKEKTSVNNDENPTEASTTSTTGAKTPTKRTKTRTEGAETLTEGVKSLTEDSKAQTEGGGKRERKKIERLEFTAADLTQKKMFEIPVGTGTLLADCPIIEHNLQSVKGEDLKILHKLLFKTPGQISTIKKNIRRFNGFAFEKNSAEYDKKMLLLVKQILADLKRICHVLDLEKGGTKEELCTRILDFLMKPEASGKMPAEKKPSKRRSNATKTEEEGSISRNAEGSEAKVEDEAGVEDESIEYKGTGVGEIGPVVTMALSNDTPPAKKTKKSPPKPKISTKSAANAGVETPTANSSAKMVDAKTSSKKTAAATASTSSPKKSPKRKKKQPTSEALVSEADISDDSHDKVDDDDDDKPLAEIKKPAFPSDEEIVEKVKGILDGADLDKITMKIVCNNIYDMYPEQDLTGKKDFIKTTVKRLIS